HVVAGAGDTVFVTSKVLGKALPAKVVARSGSSETGTPDFALLRIDETPDSSKIVPLRLNTKIDRLQNVVTGGFPGIVMSLDSSFEKIMSGDTSAIDKLAM